MTHEITYHPAAAGYSWSCSCGDGSSGQSHGRWYPSWEEARKRAERHLRRAS